ncbi:DUF366 family protein [bacterium]|nr:DUF366 family protein [bacterium]
MSLTNMKFKILSTPRDLTGEEMAPHWAYRNFGLLGDSIVALRGNFNVPSEKWMDIEAIIHCRDVYQADMLHFVIEHFQSSIREMMMRQYILLSIVEEKLLHRMEETENRLVRLGDDLFDGENRLTVTSANVTPVSAKFYLGIYLDSEANNGIRGLKSYNVKALEFAELVINQYRAEMRRLEEKSWRVMPIV